MSDVDAAAHVLPWFEELLLREGAVVERQPGGGLYACLPRELQLRTALPEAAVLRLLAPPADGEVGVALEGAAMQACLELASGRGRLAAARLPGTPRKSDRFAEAAAQTLQVDNAAVRAGELHYRPLRWLLLDLAWTVSADERAAGSLAVAHEPSLGATSSAIAESLRSRLTDAEPGGDPPAAGEIERAVAAAWPCARRELEAALVPFARSAGERFAREQRRLAAYHDKLLSEARRRRGRAASPDAAAARAAKVDAIERDRERKRQELAERFAVRCQVGVAGALSIGYETVVAELCVRRRTRERLVPVAWDPWSRAAIARTCEACGVAGRTFHACDAAVHLVCQECKATRCPVCEPAPA